MRPQSSVPTILAVVGLLLAQSVGAHVIGDSGGWSSGFTHPFLGADHVLAMLAVGFWAAQTGGRAQWAVPAAFIVMMGGGGLLGILGFPLPAVEAGVAASVLALGLLVALAVRLPLAAGMALAGGFALFHGHSHGTELPAMASPFAYAGGFLLATALMLASGVVAGRALGAKFLRVAGVCVAVAGAAFVTGLA